VETELLEQTQSLWWRALLLRETQQGADRSAHALLCGGSDHGKKILEGQERARARGVRIGRAPNPRITPELLEQAKEMLSSGLYLRETAAQLRIPRSTLHRALPKGTASLTVRKLSARSRKIAVNRWARATPEQRAQQGKLMREAKSITSGAGILASA
jgi:hypothetical protein